MTTTPWVPYRKPLLITLRRTIVIAMVLSVVLLRFWGGGSASGLSVAPLLAFGMFATATALASYPREQWPAWWMGGAAFIGVELIAHAAIQLRGTPSFYNGRG